jgi:hypothetical protein
MQKLWPFYILFLFFAKTVKIHISKFLYQADQDKAGALIAEGSRTDRDAWCPLHAVRNACPIPVDERFGTIIP